MFFKDYSLLVVFDAYLSTKCTTPDIYVMRKPWIGTIQGLRCSKYGSVLCAGNLWIAQHLRDPWIAQSHMSLGVRAVEIVIFQCQKPPSTTASQNRLCRRRKEQGDWSRVRKRKSWLTFRLVKIRAIVWHTMFSPDDYNV